MLYSGLKVPRSPGDSVTYELNSVGGLVNDAENLREFTTVLNGHERPQFRHQCQWHGRRRQRRKGTSSHQQGALTVLPFPVFLPLSVPDLGFLFLL